MALRWALRLPGATRIEVHHAAFVPGVAAGLVAEPAIDSETEAAAIDRHRVFIEEAGTLAERRARNLRSEVLGIATSRMRRRLEQTVSEDPATAGLLDRVVRRELDPATAATELLEKHVDG